MAFLTSETISITTIADGSATAYSSHAVNGLVHAIVYTPDGTTPFDDNIVVTITGETSGLAIWSETLADGDITGGVTRYPRAATHTILGAAALYAGAGVAVLDKIGLATERIKVVIAAGGNVKTGAFRFLIGD